MEVIFSDDTARGCVELFQNFRTCLQKINENMNIVK